jgi:hypothetical protein
MTETNPNATPPASLGDARGRWQLAAPSWL